MCFITDLPEAWYRIVDPARNVTFEMRWDQAGFPNLWFWQEAGSRGSYPWYGRAYCLALEPFNSIVPVLPEAVKAGEGSRILPGEQKGTWLQVSVC